MRESDSSQRSKLKEWEEMDTVEAKEIPEFIIWSGKSTFPDSFPLCDIHSGNVDPLFHQIYPLKPVAEASEPSQLSNPTLCELSLLIPFGSTLQRQHSRTESSTSFKEEFLDLPEQFTFLSVLKCSNYRPLKTTKPPWDAGIFGEPGTFGWAWTDLSFANAYWMWCWLDHLQN